jgi:rhodanese-related sulfurtransferase
MDDYQKLVEQALESVGEVMPWDLEENISDSDLILLDIREQEEFNRMHIPNSIHIPRGLLESACVWNYDDTLLYLDELYCQALFYCFIKLIIKIKN